MLAQMQKQLKDFEDQLKNIESKMYAKIRERARIEELLEAELDNECDIDKISGYKTKIDAATMIISELKKKVKRLKNTDIPWAEGQLNEVKGSINGIKYKIDKLKIENNITDKKLKKEREELEHTIRIYESEIKRNSKAIDGLIEKYKNISGKIPELLDENKVEKLSKRQIFESKYGIVDKKYEG